MLFYKNITNIFDHILLNSLRVLEEVNTYTLYSITIFLNMLFVRKMCENIVQQDSLQVAI
jgi:hypothetical protein